MIKLNEIGTSSERAKPSIPTISLTFTLLGPFFYILYIDSTWIEIPPYSHNPSTIHMPFQIAGSIMVQQGGSLLLHIGIDRYVIHQKELRNLLFLGNRVHILHLRQQVTIHGETREEKVLSGWASPSVTGRAILFEIAGSFMRKFSIPRRDVEQVVKGTAKRASLSLIIQYDSTITSLAEI